MQVFKCDRCGVYLDDPIEVFGMTLSAPYEEREVIHLCEQCYTTIKEVLEDGEIK